MKRIFTLLTLCLLIGINHGSAQNFVDKFRSESSSEFKKLKELKPFSASKQKKNNTCEGIQGEVQYLDHSLEFNKQIFSSKNDYLKMSLPISKSKDLHLKLKKVDLLSSDFILTNSRGKMQDPNLSGNFYWGYAEGYPESAIVINVFLNEVSGAIDLGDETYTLTKLKDEATYILYQEEDIENVPALSCGTDGLQESFHQRLQDETHRQAPEPQNCVKMYVEVDHDLFTRKNNSITETYNYVAGAFSQVAILYANEEVNFTLNEVKVWDEEDPYTGIAANGQGPSSSTYLNQFRSALLGTNFNGDLAHLVGVNGGGGIAYVGVLCSPNYAFGYSGVGNSYNNVPSYSWTVNVLTHEIGHNLGSPHTHACSWNGNSTQIDDCGNIFLANDNNPNTQPNACYSANNEIVPSNGGTIMSYCHLNQVGMDFNQGFGQQPGDLIRDRVYNASCLGPCEDCTTEGNACDDGDPCTDNDVYNAFCECTGTPAPDSDGDGVCDSLDPNDSDICDPNPCTNCTFTTITIVLDLYPGETSWELRNEANAIIASGSGYTVASSTVTQQVCLEDGCYDFIIRDSPYSDGICCGYGQGSYSVTDADGNILASGGEFGSSETTNFCYSNFTGCTDADDDDICDDVDPCYDPMIMDMSETLQSGTYNARQEIVLNSGTSIAENATIYLNSPTIKIMQLTSIPANSQIIVSETPCPE